MAAEAAAPRQSGECAAAGGGGTANLASPEEIGWVLSAAAACTLRTSNVSGTEQTEIGVLHLQKMAFATASLGCHADAKRDDEGKDCSPLIGYMWKTISEPQSNHEKKKIRAQTEMEKALEAETNKKVCPAVNLHGKGLSSKTNIVSSKSVSTVDGNEVSGTKLSPCLQQICRLVDARLENSAHAYHISSVQFNKEGRLVLSAGSDGKMRLSQIEGETCNTTRVQTVSLPNCHISKAAFMPNGSEIIAVDRTEFVYSYDLVNNTLNKSGPFPKWEDRWLCNFEVSPDSSTIVLIGNNRGYILLVCPRTMEKVGVVRMDGESQARSVAYTDGGNQLLSTDSSGHVYLWDLRTRRNGLVNMYDRSEFVRGGHEPAKVIGGLTRSLSVEQVKFNHDAQLLAMISRCGAHTLRLVNLPSCSVSSETWPETDLEQQFPCSLDFSPSCGLMAVGTFSGNALLFRTGLLQKHGSAI
ncbi:hypothetical protein PR202_gb28658 [Eleusine coracana subsp. coracana]|uniref:Uncharacterized protein n=1 Tax=Eleusine coracana subsp. coracana TaxID=191504 RepID=A0AAV5FXK6_ELECO|nr:hypothetical protein PR202_gb28658 [Eleusine coracana subsp. coracana]